MAFILATKKKGNSFYYNAKDDTIEQWCSNRGPQGPLEWPAKQFSFERKLNALIIQENFLENFY